MRLARATQTASGGSILGILGLLLASTISLNASSSRSLDEGCTVRKPADIHSLRTLRGPDVEISRKTGSGTKPKEKTLHSELRLLHRAQSMMKQASSTQVEGKLTRGSPP
jgi:hypothetical protein